MAESKKGYLPEESKKSKHINFALTPADNERLREKAASKGITISNYVAQLVCASLDENN